MFKRVKIVSDEIISNFIHVLQIYSAKINPTDFVSVKYTLHINNNYVLKFWEIPLSLYFPYFAAC